MFNHGTRFLNITLYKYDIWANNTKQKNQFHIVIHNLLKEIILKFNIKIVHHCNKLKPFIKNMIQKSFFWIKKTLVDHYVIVERQWVASYNT